MLFITDVKAGEFIVTGYRAWESMSIITVVRAGESVFITDVNAGESRLIITVYRASDLC